MADPFEVRMRFTSQLQHLNASVTSSQKAALYALKYRDMDEDLHSCILEQLERNSMNTRANIMYFIEHLCDMAQKESHLEFVRMVQRDILSIVDAVAPGDGSGAANVKVVRRVLSGLQSKNVLTPETLSEIEACLTERDVLPLPPAAPSAAVAGSPMHMTPTAASTATAPSSTAAPIPAAAALEGQPAPAPQKQSRRREHAVTNGIRLDKRQIEQRIEEDRERHKRLRESIWAVEADGDREFERLWEEVSDVGEDDFLAAEEDGGERKRAGGVVV